jgi:tetratricopeptide (TPR) repeat protein
MAGGNSPLLAAHLRAVRDESGLSLRQVQAASHELPEPVAFDYLSRVESGQAVPSPQKLLSLARIYQVPVQQFLDLLDLDGLKLPEGADDDPESCRVRGIAAAGSGKMREAYSIFHAGITRLQNLPDLTPEQDTLLGHLHHNLGIVLRRLGKYRAAQDHFERALESTHRPGDHVARTLTCLADVAYQQGRPQLAEGIAFASLRAARRAKDRYVLGCALVVLASIRAELGNRPSAVSLLRRAVALLNEPRGASDRVIAQGSLAQHLALLGHTEEADEMFRESIVQAERLGNPRMVSRVLFDLARSLFERGERTESARLFGRSAAIAAEHDLPPERFHSEFYLWRLALERKEAREAAERLRTLKLLRLGLDHQSEESIEFMRFLKQARSRARGRSPP